MKKLIDYFKKNYTLCIVIISIILVLIASIITISLIKKHYHKIEYKTEKVSAYEYFDTSKDTYNLTINYENDKIVGIKGGKNFYKDGYLYYDDTTHVILPKDTMLILYNLNNVTYKLLKYSEIYLDHGSNIVSCNGKKNIEYSFFIYDGEYSYLIPEESTLKVNNNEYHLSSYSYVIANPYNFVIYNYEEDQIIKIDNVNSANIKVKDTYIDLIKGVTVKNSNVYLINKNIDNHEIYKED